MDTMAAHHHHEIFLPRVPTAGPKAELCISSLSLQPHVILECSGLSMPPLAPSTPGVAKMASIFYFPANTGFPYSVQSAFTESVLSNYCTKSRANLVETTCFARVTAPPTSCAARRPVWDLR